jgi:hypothetical protein
VLISWSWGSNYVFYFLLPLVGCILNLEILFIVESSPTWLMVVHEGLVASIICPSCS